MSFLILFTASIWSGVSLYGNSALNSSKSLSSIFKTAEFDALLLDSTSKISAAWSYALLEALSLFLSHLVEDKESKETSSMILFLWYLLTSSMLLRGTYSDSLDE